MPKVTLFGSFPIFLPSTKIGGECRQSITELLFEGWSVPDSNRSPRHCQYGYQKAVNILNDIRLRVQGEMKKIRFSKGNPVFNTFLVKDFLSCVRCRVS